MKEYLIFTAADFACDEDFLNWVKYPEKYPLLDNFWQDWLHENWHKKEIIEEARHMILAVVNEKQYFPDAVQENKVWSRIQNSLGGHRPEEKPITFWQSWYSKAAVILMVMGLGWFGWNVEHKGEDSPLPAVKISSAAGYLKQINNSEAPKTIILSDGTTIILQPQSTLEYPPTFHPDNREVFLTGQAFFEVTKDASRPFLVHANEIVTRVLGTSFTVHNDTEKENVLVQVRSGKVSVFRENEKNIPITNEDQSVEGVVLMANQQVLYQRDEMKMTKGLVENPSVIIPVAKLEFEFVDAPIKDVFEAIEEAYGVEIVFDEEALSTCYLNASLSDVPLYDKLKLICRGINTTYETIDSHIIIYGKGCSEN